MRQKKHISNPISTIKNTGRDEQLLQLLQFRNIVVSQLYMMSRAIVTKTLFDGVHQSMILKDQDNENVIGGICFYSITQYQCANAIYFAMDSNYQVQGYGNYLMNNFKCKLYKQIELMRLRKYQIIVVQADTISLNFYLKNGFIEFQKKSKKLERQPREEQIIDNDIDEDVVSKYKKYQPWLEYIQDFYSTILLVYKIQPNINIFVFPQTVRYLKEELLNKINGASYRGINFSREKMESIVKEHRNKFEENKGTILSNSKLQQLSNQLQNKQLTLMASHTAISKLQQLALLDIIKKHPSSWILTMNFIKLPDTFHDEILSNLITLPFIQQNIIQDYYNSSEEMCADIMKLFENLKLFLGHGSNYYQACEKLEVYVVPFITEIYQGTFDVMKYLKKKKQEGEEKVHGGSGGVGG